MFVGVLSTNTPVGVMPIFNLAEPANVVISSLGSLDAMRRWKVCKRGPNVAASQAAVTHSFTHVIFLSRILELLLRWSVKDTDRLEPVSFSATTKPK